MLATGTSMLLLIPSNSNRRVLHPGMVLEADAQHAVCQFEELIAPVEGSDVIAFALIKEKFNQQSVRVTAYRPSTGKPIIDLLRTGEVVSAEQRQTYRVSVGTADLFAAVGKESHCQVVDISPEGFGVIASREYKLGSMVAVRFVVENHVVDTTVCVQTARQRNDGKFRYGFLVPEKTNPARRTLNATSLLMQRRQLKRMSGAA